MTIMGEIAHNAYIQAYQTLQDQLDILEHMRQRWAEATTLADKHFYYREMTIYTEQVQGWTQRVIRGNYEAIAYSWTDQTNPYAKDYWLSIATQRTDPVASMQYRRSALGD